jgi:hypothetical protein
VTFDQCGHWPWPLAVGWSMLGGVGDRWADNEDDRPARPKLKHNLTPRPSAVAGKTVFTYSGENAKIPGVRRIWPYRKTIPRPTDSLN